MQSAVAVVTIRSQSGEYRWFWPNIGVGGRDLTLPTIVVMSRSDLCPHWRTRLEALSLCVDGHSL
jgi:hypothetical protein